MGLNQTPDPGDPGDVYYDDRTKGWRSAKTGRFIPRALVENELNDHVDFGIATIQALTRAFFAGDISLNEWVAAVALELKSMHGAFAMFGAGGLRNMTPEHWRVATDVVARQFGWLGDFALAIRDRATSSAKAVARIAQYAKASLQQVWWSRARSFDYPASLPVLRQVPRDGNTPCRGHCNCQLRFTPRGIFWDLYPGEHCEKCVPLSRGGPYRLQLF